MTLDDRGQDAFVNRREKATCLTRWENCLRVLRSMTRHQRQKYLDMARWGMRTDCGTVGCAAGLCGLDPWFRRRGLRLEFSDNGEGYFAGRYLGDPDNFFVYGADKIFYMHGTHKAVVERVKNLIAAIKDMPVAA